MQNLIYLLQYLKFSIAYLCVENKKKIVQIYKYSLVLQKMILVVLAICVVVLVKRVAIFVAARELCWIFTICPHCANNIHSRQDILID